MNCIFVLKKTLSSSGYWLSLCLKIKPLLTISYSRYICGINALKSSLQQNPITAFLAIRENITCQSHTVLKSHGNPLQTDYCRSSAWLSVQRTKERNEEGQTTNTHFYFAITADKKVKKTEIDRNAIHKGIQKDRNRSKHT